MLLAGLTAGHKIGLALVAGGFILFALVTSMVVPRFRPDFPGKGGVKFYVVATLIFFVGALAAVEGFAKEKPEKEAAAATEKAAPGPKPDLAAGKKVFTSAGCSNCHTLKDAGSSGTVGPNLDQLKPPEPIVERQVTNGGKVMPAFKGTLSADQIKAVAEYVAAVAGK